jgi:hypothetical protein
MNHKTFKTFGALLAVAAVAASPVSAASYVLTDNGSTARIDADSGAGMYDWIVGSDDQLEKQWFYYRTPNSGAYALPINSISASVLNLHSGNILVTTYANSDFALTISYTLTGGTLGAGSADILESIVVQNNSGAILPFSLFQYSNFDLLGTPGGDSVNFLTWDSVKQNEGLFGIQEGIIQPTASYREAALTGAGGTLDNLLNVANYNLNNVSSQSGDVTWAFQWDYNIPIGQTLEVYKDKTLIAPAVPEPTSVVIMLLAAGALTLRRRVTQ